MCGVGPVCGGESGGKGRDGGVGRGMGWVDRGQVEEDCRARSVGLYVEGWKTDDGK